MAKFFGWMAGCFGMSMLLMACDSPTNPHSTTGPADLIGKWNVTSIHTKGWTNDDSGDKQTIDTVEAVDSGSFIIEYKSDNTVSTTQDGSPTDGTWSIKGDSVVVITSFRGISDTSSYFPLINGKSGTFANHQVNPYEDITVTVSATKQ